MDHQKLSSLIERMNNLLESEQKRLLNPAGLQPIHLRVLKYLMICNRYSNTPYALSRFLGNTKGTTSQTLKILENRGYITKYKDKRDLREVHINITVKGKELVNTVSSKMLSEKIKDQNVKKAVSVLELLLKDLQMTNNFNTFGVCYTCMYFTRGDNGFSCGLTGEELQTTDTEKICYEHKNIVA